MTTTLLFIHGIGGPDKRRKWVTALDNALIREGFASIRDAEDVRIAAPDYFEALMASSGQPRARGLTPNERVVTESERRSYMGRRRRLAAKLKVSLKPTAVPPVRGALDNKAIQQSALRGKTWSRIRAYIDDPGVRRSVWSDVLEAVPTEGPVILIGHSMGSVVAADIIPRLAPTVEVPLLLTIGSPLGLDLFASRRQLTRAANFPLDRVGVWLNLYDTADFVTLARGAGRGGGPALDVPISTGRAGEARGKVGIAEHDAAAYLSHRLAARAIGLTLDRAVTSTPPSAEANQHANRNLLEPLVWRLAWTQARGHQCRLDKDHKRGDRVERAHDTLAERWQRQLSQHLPAIHPGNCLTDPLKALRGDLSRTELVIWLTLLSLDHPEAPYFCGDPGDEARDAIRRRVWKAALNTTKGAQQASDAIAVAIRRSRSSIGDSPKALDRAVAALAPLPLLSPDPQGSDGLGQEATRLMAAHVRGGQPAGLMVLARLCGVPAHDGQWGTPETVRSDLIDFTADMEPSAFRGMLTGLIAASAALDALKLRNTTRALTFCEQLHDRCAHDLQLHRARDADVGTTLDAARARALAAKRAVTALEAASAK